MPINRYFIFFLFHFFLCGCSGKSFHEVGETYVSPCENYGKYQVVNGKNVEANYIGSGEFILVKFHAKNVAGANMIGVSFTDHYRLFEVPVAALKESEINSGNIDYDKNGSFHEVWINAKSFDGRFCISASYHKNLIDTDGVVRGYIFNEIIPLSFADVKESSK